MNTKIVKIVNKYKSIPEPVKASLWFTICSVVQKGIGFITTPFFARLMTTSQFGKYSVYLSWESILIIFATLNLASSVYNNAMIKYEDKIDEVTSSFLGLSTVTTAVLFVIYILFSNQINNATGLNTVITLAMFVQMFLEPAYQFWATKQRFNYKYKKLILITLFIAVGSPALGIIAVIMSEYKTEARVISYVFVTAIVGIVFYVRTMAKGKKFFDSVYWKYALAFNLPLLPHYLAQKILNQSDKIMIDKYMDSTRAAFYSVAFTIASVLQIVITAVNSSFVPYIYTSIKQKENNKIKNVSFLILICISIMCLFVMLLGPELVYIVGGKQYMEAIWCIPPIVASIYFIFLYCMFANVEFYYEKTKFMMVGSIIIAILNVIFNYVGIVNFGYISVSYVTLICYILFSIVHYLYYKKIIVSNGVDSLYNEKMIFIYSIIFLVISFGILISYMFNHIRYICLVVLFFILLFKWKDILNSLKVLSKKSDDKMR